MKEKKGDKKKIIERLLNVPAKQKRMFWAREMKFLNDFLKKYPDMGFWSKVSFGAKLDSLLLLKGETGEQQLRKKFLEYKYIIPDKKTYNIGKKSGKDIDVNPPPKTLKEFLKQ